MYMKIDFVESFGDAPKTHILAGKKECFKREMGKNEREKLQAIRKFFVTQVSVNEINVS